MGFKESNAPTTKMVYPDRYTAPLRHHFIQVLTAVSCNVLFSQTLIPYTVEGFDRTAVIPQQNPEALCGSVFNIYKV